MVQMKMAGWWVWLIVAGVMVGDIDSARGAPQFIFSFHQGFMLAESNELNNFDNSVTARETRYSLMTLVDIESGVSAFGEIFGENSSYTFSDPDTSLEPQLMQAGGTITIPYVQAKAKIGIMRLPIGLDGASRDVGLADRMTLSSLNQPLLGFAPRNFRGILFNRYFTAGDGDIFLDLYYGELHQQTSMEFLARLSLPSGMLGPLIGGGGEMLNEDGVLGDDVVRNLVGTRIEMTGVLPTLSMVASGWIGLVREEGQTPRKQKDVWILSCRGDWSLWTLQLEYGEQGAWRPGQGRVRSAGMRALNTIRITDQWAITLDYHLVLPDFVKRRTGSYRLETVAAGLEWLPWSSVAIHLSMSQHRGEVVLTRNDRLWDFERSYALGVSIAYF